jgi:pyruvate formate lyase activating enzyme
VVDLRGWARTSLIDFPGHIATVLFTGGCDFRCPMCHNRDLVLRPGSLPAIDPAEVLDFIARRAGKVTGVVVTGGEPLLQAQLAPFLAALRVHDVAVKLDTNGYHPEALAALLDAGLLDYVAMDVKAPEAKYGRLAGCPSLDVARPLASIALLLKGQVAFEFRTTVVPGLLDGDDIEAIARRLADLAGRSDSIPYVLQQFRGIQTLDPALEGRPPYASEELLAMADRARRRLDDVMVRGI